jgi:hypothetical protein
MAKFFINYLYELTKEGKLALKRVRIYNEKVITIYCHDFEIGASVFKKIIKKELERE